MLYQQSRSFRPDYPSRVSVDSVSTGRLCGPHERTPRMRSENSTAKVNIRSLRCKVELIGLFEQSLGFVAEY